MKPFSMALLAVLCMAAQAHGQRHYQGYHGGYSGNSDVYGGYHDGYKEYPDSYNGNYNGDNGHADSYNGNYNDNNGHPDSYNGNYYGDNGHADSYNENYNGDNGYADSYNGNYNDNNGYPDSYNGNYNGDNGHRYDGSSYGYGRPRGRYNRRDRWSPPKPDMFIGFCNPLCSVDKDCLANHVVCDTNGTKYEQTDKFQCSEPRCNRLRWPTFDGSCNNLNNKYWGAAKTCMIRITEPKVDQPKTPPAMISEKVLKAATKFNPNPFGVSQLQVVYGQSLIHETSITEKVKNGNGFTFLDGVSSYLDLSAVYGSSKDMNNELRLFRGGRMKSSIVDGDEHLPKVDGKYKAGDDRLNENPGLHALHTIWLRNHNRLARKCMREHGFPALAGGYPDHVCFQNARRGNIATFQAITYNEFLPTMIGQSLPKYRGYNRKINAGTFAEFTSSIFRLCHAQIPYYTIAIAYDGEVKYYKLSDQFFKSNLMEKYSVSQLLKGANYGCAERIAPAFSDSIRTTLFKEIDGVFDLGAFDIRQSRKHLLPDIDTLRMKLDMEKYDNFTELVGDDKKCLVDDLESVYDSVDESDLIVTMLSEKLARVGQIGRTAKKVMMDQFYTWREGDKWWFENGRVSGLSQYDIAHFNSLTLSKLIEINTHQYFPTDAFLTSTCCFRDGKKSLNKVCIKGRKGGWVKLPYCEVQARLKNNTAAYPGTQGYNCNCKCNSRGDGYASNSYYKSDYKRVDQYDMTNQYGPNHQYDEHNQYQKHDQYGPNHQYDEYNQRNQYNQNN